VELADSDLQIGELKLPFPKIGQGLLLGLVLALLPLVVAFLV
jgi:hypothetical protein